MSKRLLYALIIMALTVIVLIFNRGHVSINLFFGTIDAFKPIAFFVFVGIGVVIGILLK